MGFEPEGKLIRQIVPHNQPFFDVGANSGFYAALVEDLVGPENLFLFEPLPHLASRLRRLFRRSHVHQCALSSATGTTTIRTPFINGERFDTRSTLETSFQETDQSATESIEIQTQTMDTFVRESGINMLGFVKVDVEGHEQSVLHGSLESIRQLRPILMIEIEQRHHKTPIQEIFEEVAALDYSGFYIDVDQLEIRCIESFDLTMQSSEDFGSLGFFKYVNNFIFIPNESTPSALLTMESWIARERIK